MEGYLVKHKVSLLIISYLREELSREEENELQDWINASAENQQVFNELTKEESLRAEVKEVPELRKRILQKIYQELPETRKVVPLMKRPIIKWMTAAAVLGFVIWSLVFLVNRDKESGLPVATTPLEQDVKAPETNKAMITLADGRKVFLDSVNSGIVATEGLVKVIRTDDGSISYQSSDESSKLVVYNTLTNPRGSKVIAMTLADGSRVWLNAGSSVTYPVAFVDNERKVTIDGEAYFEIAHDKSKPFKVGKGEMEITVLGTHFNVNAYDDESVLKVTLLEGLVIVRKALASVKLIPGQQATLHFDKLSAGQSDITVASNVDVEEVMAWKNGFFRYRSASLPSLMRQAARWYDVEVEFAGKIPSDTYSGSLPRSVSLGTWLKVLEESGVKFKISGKKVTILP